MAKVERMPKLPVVDESVRPERSDALRSGVRRVIKQRRLSRAEKSQLIRNKLFDSAAKVVGKHGYSDAMVSLITSEAHVAQGTFYNYFESRQHLFDQLLPSLG